MAEVTLHFSIAGVKPMQFNRIALDLRDFSEPLREIGHVIHDSIRTQFRREGGVVGDKWAALKKWYAARKARRYPGKTILRATDRLMLSITSEHAQGSVFEVTPTQLTVGTDVTTPDGRWNLGLIHDKGAPRANITARPIIVVPTSARTRIRVVFRQWLERKAAAADLTLT